MELEKRLDIDEKFNSEAFKYFLEETKINLEKSVVLGEESYYETLYEWEKIVTPEDKNKYGLMILELIRMTRIKADKKKYLLDLYTQTANEISQKNTLEKYKND